MVSPMRLFALTQRSDAVFLVSSHFAVSRFLGVGLGLGVRVRIRVRIMVRVRAQN